MGDHTETIQLDYNPLEISYEDLMRIYFSYSNTCRKPYSVQYASIIFYHDEEQKLIAEKVKMEIEDSIKEKTFVELRPFDKFYLAEKYHQKYYLQLVKEIKDEFLSRYIDFMDFVNSTAAMKVNCYVKGSGSISHLEGEIEQFGLTPKVEKTLLDIVTSYGR